MQLAALHARALEHAPQERREEEEEKKKKRDNVAGAQCRLGQRNTFSTAINHLNDLDWDVGTRSSPHYLQDCGQGVLKTELLLLTNLHVSHPELAWIVTATCNKDGQKPKAFKNPQALTIESVLPQQHLVITMQFLSSITHVAHRCADLLLAIRCPHKALVLRVLHSHKSSTASADCAIRAGSNREWTHATADFGHPHPRRCISQGGQHTGSGRRVFLDFKLPVHNVSAVSTTSRHHVGVNRPLNLRHQRC